MALEQVKNEILEEAQNKAKEIALEGKKRKEEIIEEGQTKAEEIKEQKDKEIENEKESLRREKLSNARMEGKKMQIETKEEIIDDTFKEFREKIREKIEENPEEFVKTCIEKTEFQIGKIIGQEKYRNHVEERNIEFEAEDRDGIAILSENEEKRKDFSTEKILSEFKNRYRKNIAKKLFN